MSNYRAQQCQRMLDALYGAGEAGLTRKQFADLLKIKKSNHLNGLIKELVERDLAICKRLLNDHNRPLFVYFSPESQVR